MAKVTSTEFQQSVGTYSDAAMREPLIITSHNRDRLVLMGVDEYQRLKALEDAATERLMDERIAVHRDTLLKLAK